MKYRKEREEENRQTIYLQGGEPQRIGWAPLDDKAQSAGFSR